MLNNVFLVGYCSKILENGEENITLEVAVSSSFKNSKGEYDVDTISCILIGSIAGNAKEYINVNNLVGIKGRLQETSGNVTVLVEKITFLSSKKESDNE